MFEDSKKNESIENSAKEAPTPRKMRVYLDNCAYNRPYDDQSQVKIELETQAKLKIQRMIKDHQIELASSYMSLYECGENPDSIRAELDSLSCFEQVLCYQYPGVFNNPSLHPQVGEDAGIALYRSYAAYRSAAQ